MNCIRILAFACLTLSVAATGSAQSRAEHLQWSAKASAALADHDYETALEFANKIAVQPAGNDFRRVAGDILLRCGDSKRAVELFDQYLDGKPQDRPYLWQYGIALYFDGKFKEGAKLFEVHREVNPNDVENAAWHFLCVAKSESADKAKQLLLPAPNDPRAPMEQVLEMLRTGDTDSVKQHMTGRSSKFYGDFYLGLYADALGDHATAQRHLDAAAKDAPANYMGDVARVYARHLTKQKPAK